MKWLRSTNTQTYTVMGKVIPAFTKEPLAVSEEEYSKIMGMSVIKSLVENNCIVTMSKYKGSSDTVSTNQKVVDRLSTENSMLARRNEQLEAELASAVSQDKYNALVSEAEQEIARLKAENEKLQTKLAKKSAKEATEEVSE